MEFNEITTVYVAKYYCIHTEVIGEIKKPNFDYSNEVNSLKASSIYIYVDGKLIELLKLCIMTNNFYNLSDPDVLLVGVDDIFIHVYQHQNYTVPCKPTSKSVIVKLLHESEEVNKGHRDNENGFSFDGKSLGPFSGELECTGSNLTSILQMIKFIVHTNDDECNFTILFLLNIILNR